MSPWNLGSRMLISHQSVVKSEYEARVDQAVGGCAVGSGASREERARPRGESLGEERGSEAVGWDT